MARKILLFQQSTITSDIKHVVTIITVITANPVQESRAKHQQIYMRRFTSMYKRSTTDSWNYYLRGKELFEYGLSFSFLFFLPCAFAKCFVSLKPIVTARHSTISIQLISGMYICPCTVEDVCTIFTPGKQFNEEHCLIIEKVPVIIAWLPTTAASIAITRTGHLSDSTKTVAYISASKYANF